jgi:hypothetical protein
MEAVERSGRPSIGIFGEAFGPMAKLLGRQIGLAEERLAIYPGMMATDSRDRLAAVARDVLTPMVVTGLTSGGAVSGPSARPAAKTDQFAVAFSGSLDEVQDHFYDQGWSDGLPIMPPTRDRVDAFLRAGGRDPHEVLGILPPSNNYATVGNVAINGVMAGCRPEHMPILTAAVECLADPAFRLEDAGSTPGWEPLVIVSGPMAAELDFNSETGVMRVGRRSNTSVGRFLRLYMRNVAGLRIRPGVTDQAGFGATFNVAMAENEAAVQSLGWEPFRVGRGFSADDNVVTVHSVLNISAPIYTEGDDPMHHLRWISYHLERAWSMSVPAYKRGGGFQLLAMSPAIAQVFADNGMNKADIRRYLVENTRANGAILEEMTEGTPFHLDEWMRDGRVPREYSADVDPQRRVPIFLGDDWVDVIVAGNPGRNQSRGYGTNHVQGLPISRRVTSGTSG